jgi:hypothetical protein
VAGRAGPHLFALMTLIIAITLALIALVALTDWRRRRTTHPRARAVKQANSNTRRR